MMIQFRKTGHSEGWMLLSSREKKPSLWEGWKHRTEEEGCITGRGTAGQKKVFFFCPKAVLCSETCVKLLSELTDTFLDLKQVLKSQKSLHHGDDRKSSLGKKRSKSYEGKKVWTKKTQNPMTG